MTKIIMVSEELRAKMVAAAAAKSVKQSTLDAMAASGVDLTTPSGKAFVEEVVVAAAKYDALFAQAVDEAMKSGFVPGLDSLTLSSTSGYVKWERPDDVNLSDAITPVSSDGKSIAPVSDGAGEDKPAAETQEDKPDAQAEAE